jgi:sporulation protein YlmC with PRC-barrel domain
MFSKKFSILIAATALSMGPALAQTAWVEIEDNVQVPAFGASVDQIDDWDVFDASGMKVGEVEEVVGENTSTASALVIDLEGNGGYPDQDVVIPLDQFAWENDRLVLNADAESVAAMEIWND